jgi:hypothetical protein
MPFAKSLADAPWSPRAHAFHLVDQHIASAAACRSYDGFEPSVLPSSRREAPRWTIREAVSRLTAETATFRMRAGTAVPHASVAIVSWLIAEFFAGHAACALTMYPLFTPEGDGADHGDRITGVANLPSGPSGRRAPH